MMSFDPIYRAAYNYEDITGHHDFIKPVVYSFPASDRMLHWALDSMSDAVLRELGDHRLMQVLYDVLD